MPGEEGTRGQKGRLSWKTEMKKIFKIGVILMLDIFAKRYVCWYIFKIGVSLLLDI